MFRRNQTTYLPLLLSGLPVLAVEWLRIAGVPAVPYQTTAALSRQGQNAAGQILVFDARSATGRLDSRTARECGAAIINVADVIPRELIAAPGSARRMDDQTTQRLQADRALFLEELKQRIEAAGGFWLRLADYPFPFQSAACASHDPARDRQELARLFAVADNWWMAPQPGGSGQHDSAIASIGQRYASGQPVFIGPFIGQDSLTTGDDAADRFPLMWRTSSEEFRRWSRARLSLDLVVWRRGTTYRIQCTTAAGEFRPAVELWLGSHLASFPLSSAAMTVREEGVVFVQEQRRHAGGMAAWRPADTGLSQPENCFVHQTV